MYCEQVVLESGIKTRGRMTSVVVDTPAAAALRCSRAPFTVARLTSRLLKNIDLPRMKNRRLRRKQPSLTDLLHSPAVREKDGGSTQGLPTGRSVSIKDIVTKEKSRSPSKAPPQEYIQELTEYLRKSKIDSEDSGASSGTNTSSDKESSGHSTRSSPESSRCTDDDDDGGFSESSGRGKRHLTQSQPLLKVTKQPQSLVKVTKQACVKEHCKNAPLKLDHLTICPKSHKSIKPRQKGPRGVRVGECTATRMDPGRRGGTFGRQRAMAPRRTDASEEDDAGFLYCSAGRRVRRNRNGLREANQADNMVSTTTLLHNHRPLSLP